MSTTRVLTSVAGTSLDLACPTNVLGFTTLVTRAHQHSVVATYFAHPAAVAYYATAHKATWLKSGSRSSLGK